MKRKIVTALAASLAGVLLVSTCDAQQVRREVLKELHVDDVGGCQRLTTRLQFPMAIQGYVPTAHGTLLTVKMLPLDKEQAAVPALVSREALPAHAFETPLQQVTWEGDAAEGPQLLFQFDRDVTFNVESGADFRSVVVTLHPVTKDPAPCTEVQSNQRETK